MCYPKDTPLLEPERPINVVSLLVVVLTQFLLISKFRNFALLSYIVSFPSQPVFAPWQMIHRLFQSLDKFRIRDGENHYLWLCKHSHNVTESQDWQFVFMLPSVQLDTFIYPSVQIQRGQTHFTKQSSKMMMSPVRDEISRPGRISIFFCLHFQIIIEIHFGVLNLKQQLTKGQWKCHLLRVFLAT